MLNRRYHRVDFFLGLQCDKTKVVSRIERPVDEVGGPVIKSKESNVSIVVLLEVHVPKSKLRNLVDSVEPRSHVRVVQDFALTVASDENAVLPDFIVCEVFPEATD